MSSWNAWFGARDSRVALPVMPVVLLRVFNLIFALLYFGIGGTAGNNTLALAIIGLFVVYEVVAIVIELSPWPDVLRFRTLQHPLDVLVTGLTAGIDPRSLAPVALIGAGSIYRVSTLYRAGMPLALGGFAALVALLAAGMGDLAGNPDVWGAATAGRIVLFLLAGALFSWQAVAEQRAAQERDEMVQQLARGERRYRDLFEGAGDGIIVTDMADAIVDCNALAARMGGFTRDDLIGKPASFLVPEETQRKHDDIAHRLHAGEHVPAYECEMYAADRSRYPVESTARLVRDERGEPAGLQYILRRIDDRKRTEQELERRARYLAAISEVEQLLLQQSARDSYEPITTILARTTGASRVHVAELRTLDREHGPRTYLCMAAETVDEPTATHIALRATELPLDLVGDDLVAPLQRGEAVTRRIDEMGELHRAWGDFMQVKSFLALPITVHGELAGYIGFDDCVEARDWQPAEINLLRAAATAIALSLEWETAEASRATSERRFRAIFGGAADGIAVHGLDGEIIDTNGHLMRTLGYTHDDIVGHAIFAFVADDPERLNDIGRRVLRGEPVGAYESSLRAADGRIVPMELTTHALFDGGGELATGFLTVLRDISDRKRAEQELERRARYLAALAQVQERLLAAPGRAAYDDVVRILAEAAGAHRVFIRELDRAADGALWLTARAEHRTAAVTSVFDHLHQHHVDDLASPRWHWLPPMLRGEAASGVASEQPPEHRVFLDALQIKSYLAIPLMVHGELSGTISFDDCHDERRWQPVEIDLLQAAANALALSLEREQAAEALTRSEERFRGIVQSVDAVVYEADASTFGFTFVSDQVEAILGYPRAQWLGSTTFWADHIHPEDRERVLAICRSATRAMEDHQFEYRMLAADGRYVWLRDIVTVAGKDGSPAILRGLMIDTTAEREAAEALQRSQVFLTTIIDASPLGIQIYDRTGRATRTNAAHHELYDPGVYPYEVDAFNILTDPLAIESGLAEYARHAFAGETVEAPEIPITLRPPDGASDLPPIERILEVALFPIRPAGAPVDAVVAISRDMTDRRREEEVLRRAQKLESLGALASGVAHDFNNLIMTVLGNAWLAIQDLPEASPALEPLREIERAGQRAAELGKQMLDYSGNSQFRTERIDLNATVRESSELLRAVVPETAELTFDLARGLPPVDGDATQLQQVLINLVLNAAEAVGEAPGEILVVTRVRRLDAADLGQMTIGDGLAPGAYVVLDVRDTGSGIAEEELERIFDPFFTTRFIGRGLGLAAALGIVRGHNGAINVESAPGKGSIFSVFLPRAEVAEHE